MIQGTQRTAIIGWERTRPGTEFGSPIPWRNPTTSLENSAHNSGEFGSIFGEFGLLFELNYLYIGIMF